MAAAELFDVAVIGGGPAGSSFATYARRKGLSVVVFERERFPRDHVGESLIPFTYDNLRDMGVLDEVRKFATRKPGINFVDTDGTRESTWCFSRILKDEASVSIHTLRAPFDKALLDNARRLGAVVHEQTAVRDVDLDAPGGLARVDVEHAAGERRSFDARFVVDASGQGTYLARKLGVKRSYPDLDRVAFFSHWVNTRYDAALNEGLIKIIYLGGDKKGWIWVIPVGTNHLSVGVTLNNAHVREMRARLAPGSRDGKDWMQALYLEELRSAPALDGILGSAVQEHEVLTIGDYSYYAERKFGPRHALIGDAGAFLDPIFSSGIHVAMESARRIAAAVHVKLREDDAAGNARLAEEYRVINDCYELIEKFIRLFYTPEVLNFAQVDPSAGMSFDKFVRAGNIFHFLLAGDFFHNSRKYSNFIDSLLGENRYNRFIEYVHEKHGYTGATRTCGYTFEDIYGHLG